MSECLRVIELFAGIGAQASALERLGIDHERIAVAEFDEPTYKVYCAIHGDTPNLGDITKIEHLPECDLLTYSSPCQDISIAGHKKGLAKGSGTRSATLWDVGRLLEDMKERGVLPEVLLMENVNSILFKHAIKDFLEWVGFLEKLGYTNSYAVLNAKDYGIPQNRKRMFMVSTLHSGKLRFPDPKPLTIRLKDVLEKDVPESYYLSEKTIAFYERHRISQEEKGNGFGWHPLDPDKDVVGRALTTRKDYQVGNYIIEYPKKEIDNLDSSVVAVVSERQSENTFIKWLNGSSKTGYSPAYEGDGVKIYPNPARNGSGGTVQKKSTNTLNTYKGCGSGTPIQTKDGLRIRYLTPRECFRLMGQPEDAIDRILATEPTKTRQYKMAGNSIVVNVLVDIFRAVYIDKTFAKKEKTYNLEDFA